MASIVKAKFNENKFNENKFKKKRGLRPPHPAFSPQDTEFQPEIPQNSVRIHWNALEVTS